MRMIEKEKENFYEWLFVNTLTGIGIKTMYNANTSTPQKAEQYFRKKLKLFGKKNASFRKFATSHQEVNSSVVQDLKKFVDQFISKHGLTNYTVREAFKKWGAISWEKYEKEYAYLKIREIERLRVRLTPSVSKGHYDYAKHKIYIDPRKNKTSKQKMATLKFELDNSLSAEARRKLKASKDMDVEKKAWASIKLEVQTSKREIQRLVKRHNAKDLEDLVLNGKEPDKTNPWIDQKRFEKYLKKATYSKSTIEKVRIPMPSVGELADQDKRNALKFYQMRGWDDQWIAEEFAYTPHVPGSSTTTLEDEKKKMQED